MGFGQNALVIVHLGAGYHSSSRRDQYLRLCEETCDLVIRNFVETSGNLMDSVEKGVVHLEVSLNH